MATRAIKELKNSILKEYIITNGTTMVVGSRVKFITDDQHVDLAAANDDGAFGTVDSIRGTGVGTSVAPFSKVSDRKSVV